MGIGSIGRNLVMRQLPLAGVVLALGAFAYMGIAQIESAVVQFASGRPNGSAAMISAVQTASAHVVVATVIAALLVIAVAMAAMHVAVDRPVAAIAASVESLANGDRSVSIQGESRDDDLGVAARGLRRIQDTLVALDERVAASAKPVTTSIPTDGAQGLSSQVEKYSTEMANYVDRLSGITRRLAETSHVMIKSAKSASDGSDQATNASSNAASDVSSVATASEQLLDSIEEISRQVVQSTNVVKAAVERAVETNAGMGRLSAAAQKVGDVVSLISRIAAQTNLLALNATIEAARAGEAGRGFAVVAQEVKTLATQTAKATQDITGQIAEMQEATELSVVAIDKIQKKIREVEHISTIIAAAVHEQGAATQEIARNVRSAAAGTATMSGHVDAIVRSVEETSSSASSVAELAREFDELTTTMSKMVHRATKFATTIRAA